MKMVDRRPGVREQIMYGGRCDRCGEEIEIITLGTSLSVAPDYRCGCGRETAEERMDRLSWSGRYRSPLRKQEADTQP